MNATPPNTSWRASAIWLASGAALGALGSILLLFEERIDALVGFGTGPLGANFVILGVVGGAIGLYYLSISRPRRETAVTLGEKTALVSLVGTALVAVYVFSRLEILGWDGGPGDRVLVRVVALMILVSMAEGAAVSFLRKRETAEMLEDERDALIRQRAARGAHAILLVLLAVFVVQIGFGAAYVGLTSPAAIAHALAGMVILSELARHAAEVWLYRRDRV